MPWPCPLPKRARQAKSHSRWAQERWVEAAAAPRARPFAARGQEAEPQAPRFVRLEPASEPELSVERAEGWRLARPSTAAAAQIAKKPGRESASARGMEWAARA